MQLAADQFLHCALRETWAHQLAIGCPAGCLFGVHVIGVAWLPQHPYHSTPVSQGLAHTWFCRVCIAIGTWHCMHLALSHITMPVALLEFPVHKQRLGLHRWYSVSHYSFGSSGCCCPLHWGCIYIALLSMGGRQGVWDPYGCEQWWWCWAVS